MQKWIFYSTLVAVFSDELYVMAGSTTLFAFYFVVVFNLVYLASIGRLWLPRKLLWGLGYLTLSGVLGLVLNTNSMEGFLKAYIGIVMCALYYAAFLRYTRFDVCRVFRVYARYSFYVAAFGLVYLPFQPGIKGRLTSILLEPSIFCLICLPAAYYYADEWQRLRKHGVRCLVLLAAIVLTLSSVGYFGAMLGLYLFGGRYRRGRLAFGLLVGFVGVGIYASSDLFRLRLDDSVQVLASMDVSNVNQSTFGVALSYLVIREQFAAHPVFGGGLGSNVVAHDLFVPSIPELLAFQGQQILDLGRWDASSLLLRILSELGLVGLGYALWFMWWYWPREGGPEQKAIATSLLCYFLMKFMRAGSYFQTETIFFVSIYAVNGLLVQTQAMLQRKPAMAKLMPASLPMLPPLEQANAGLR